ncbi:MAG: hypothetical protein IPM54_14410 [Polyangiaceae bacterium]|nr:hypothetical protein [Polyangiaceae bacterium]
MKRTLLLFVVAIEMLGCRHASIEREVLEKAEYGEENPVFVEETTTSIVGFTKAGDVAVFDGQTGEIKSSVEGGGGTPRDVAVDPWREGVWVYEENEDASGGEIRFCKLENTFGEANGGRGVLHSCEHTAWVDGVAALLPAREGLWVFEDGIGGARWKVLGTGTITPSVSAPRPASVWMEGERVEALSYGFYGDQLVKVGAIFGGAGPTIVEQFDWGTPAGYPPTARYARLSHDAGLLFDAAGGTLTVRRVTGGEIGLPRVIDVGIQVSRVEAALAVGASTLVLGTDALWIVEADESGVELMSGLWLNGDVRVSDLFFSRDLLVTQDRAFVATDRGVRAIVLEKDGDVVVNAFLDELFVGEWFRGPLDVVRGTSL